MYQIFGKGKNISVQVFTIPGKERKLSSIIEAIDDSESGQILKKRFKEYVKDGLYYELFESQEESIFRVI